MATQEPEQNNALSKVARSVGSALGTVASKVNDLVGEKSEADEKPEDKNAAGSDKKAAKSESESTSSADADSKKSDDKSNASTAAGSKSSEKSESKPAKASGATASTKAAPAKKSTASAATKSKSRAQQVKKLKRDKHRRKLGRKTRG